MTVDLARLLTATRDARTWRDQVAVRRDAALLLAFAGGRRRSEVVGLEVRDLHPESSEHGERIRIMLHGSKISLYLATEFFIERGRDSLLCPWCALLDWRVPLGSAGLVCACSRSGVDATGLVAQTEGPLRGSRLVLARRSPSSSVRRERSRYGTVGALGAVVRIAVRQ
ncbi:hypothetical protein [Nocardia abscessus]|uniref:hypothetical protein n=1 Tax=Nocardia abscessus TaxID=120957 RepID=UPI00245787AC|nr:hypothetical protein [Nocardia abscessus]